MDNIKATYNIDSKEWVFETLPDEASKDELQFAFCSNNGPAIFADLRFGYELADADKIVPGEAFAAGSSFPKFGESYERADTTKAFVMEKLDCKHDMNYKLSVWAFNNSEKGNGAYTFSTPKPTKEFPSWTWDEAANYWVPPVVKPTDSPTWWNEDTQSWVAIHNAELIPHKPKDFDSWTWSESANAFVAPVPKPTTDGIHQWDEASQTWVTVTLPDA
jgi:hypothetical protein